MRMRCVVVNAIKIVYVVYFLITDLSFIHSVLSSIRSSLWKDISCSFRIMYE
jgi:hypothetical protein